MKRRTFLAAASSTVAASTLSAPAISQGIRELKLVQSWPASVTYANALFARLIAESSDGRMKIKTYSAGELVDAFEVFDAVAEGIADMYHSAEVYWRDRSPAFEFFNTVPFGLTSIEVSAWMQHGGGQELWDELSANFNIKPFLFGNTGVQMGGWYRKEMKSVEEFKGLRIRYPGMGGDVLRRLGATVVLLPPSEIVPAMKSGALDAAEWSGPNYDLASGLHTAASYYYYPGFHDPGNANSLGINRELWNDLSASERSIIATAAETTLSRVTGYELNARMRALPVLLKEHGVQLRKFDDDLLRAFGKISGEVAAEVGNSDPFTRRVYESYMNFRKLSREWVDISERAYLNARDLDFPYDG